MIVKVLLRLTIPKNMTTAGVLAYLKHRFGKKPFNRYQIPVYGQKAKPIRMEIEDIIVTDKEEEAVNH